MFKVYMCARDANLLFANVYTERSVEQVLKKNLCWKFPYVYMYPNVCIMNAPGIV